MVKSQVLKFHMQRARDSGQRSSVVATMIIVGLCCCSQAGPSGTTLLSADAVRGRIARVHSMLCPCPLPQPFPLAAFSMCNPERLRGGGSNHFSAAGDENRRDAGRERSNVGDESRGLSGAGGAFQGEPAVTQIPVSAARLAALRKAMKEAPESAEHLWSRELQEEEWVSEGILPPRGEPSLRLDSRGVQMREGRAHDSSVRAGELEGEGPIEADSGMEEEGRWAERMSKLLDGQAEDRQAVDGAGAEERGAGPDDVSESQGPMSSFGGRKRLGRGAADIGRRAYGDMAASDSERAAFGGTSEAVREEEWDERRAREQELLRGLDTLEYQQAESQGERDERERLMSSLLEFRNTDQEQEGRGESRGGSERMETGAGAEPAAPAAPPTASSLAKLEGEAGDLEEAASGRGGSSRALRPTGLRPTRGMHPMQVVEGPEVVGEGVGEGSSSGPTDPEETARNFERHLERRRREEEAYMSVPWEERQKLDLRDDPFNIWGHDHATPHATHAAPAHAPLNPDQLFESAVDSFTSQRAQERMGGRGVGRLGSEEQREEEAGADSYPSRHTRDFGYAGDGDGQGEEAGREYSGDGGIHPATRRMDTEWYVLHTMHRNLTEMEVALNCELRNAVKRGDEEAVERLVQQGASVNEPMPDYIVPTERYEDATLAMVWPPLHWAAAIGKHAGMVVKLVKLGARIDALDATHTTGRYYWDDECPLRTKLTDEESRANYNLQMNMTALHYACFFGKSEAVEALCSLGASVIVPDDRNRTCIEVAAYQGLKPDYKRAPIFAALKERLKKEVAGEGWRNYWPQLCNLSYYKSTELPDRMEDLTEEQRYYLEIPGHGPNRSLHNLSSVDIDQILRHECRPNDDPTVAKNEMHLRYHVRYPEMQLVEPYVEGKPFFPWPDHEEDEGGAQGATADRDD